MSDTKHIEVTLQISGDPDDGGRTPTGGVLISIDSSFGINWEEAVNELTSKLTDWAVSFLKYQGTNEVLIRPARE